MSTYASNIQAHPSGPIHLEEEQAYPHLRGYTVCGIWLQDFSRTDANKPGEGVTCKRCLRRLGNAVQGVGTDE